MQGTKAEIGRGVWRLRVYAGRRANGTPIQLSKTVHGPEAKPGSGTRLADRELAKMVAKVASGSGVTGAATVSDLLDRWLDHCDSLGRSPTTMRKYRQIAEAVVRPELGKIRLTKLTAADLDRLYAKLTAKGNKATTVRRVHSLSRRSTPPGRALVHGRAQRGVAGYATAGPSGASEGTDAPPGPGDREEGRGGRAGARCADPLGRSHRCP